MARENFTVKIAPLRNEASFTKLFHNPRLPSAKSRFRYEKGLSLQNYFATTKHPLGTWVPFRSPKPHFAAAKPSKAFISQPKHSLWNHFVVAKRPFGIRVPFHSPTLPFRNCEMGCENSPWLWNKPSPATISTVTQIPILTFKLLKTISHRSFALRKPPFGAKKEPSHSTISRGPPSEEKSHAHLRPPSLKLL